MAIKLVGVCIRDSAAGIFNSPMFVPRVEVGVRTFVNEVNRADDKNPLYSNPEDFELYVVAEFEDETAKVTPVDPPQLLIRGKDAKRSIQ